MIKRFFLLSLALILTFSMLQLTGCKKGSSKQEGPVTITIWAWDPNFNIAIMEEAKNRYAAINPDVQFDIVDFAKGDLEQKLHTILASGMTKDLPDIVLIEDYNAQKYLQSYPGSFADLSDSINYNDFLPYKTEIMTVEGKQYGVPFDTGSSGFFYRSDILKEAGYEASDLQSLTWNDYINIALDVKAKTGKYLATFDVNDGGIIRIMMQSAGSWYFDSNGKVNLADNEALALAMKRYKEMFTKDAVKRTSGWGEWVGAFNNGDAASVTTGVWIIGSVKAAEDQSGKWAVAPTPRLDIPGSVNASNLGGSSWYVMDSSEAKAEAIDFLNQIYGKDIDFYQKILVDRGAVGSFIPSQSGEAYSKADDFFGGQKVYIDFAEWNKKIPSVSYGMNTYEADNVIMAKFQEVLKGADIKEMLQQAQEQVESQIQ